MQLFMKIELTVLRYYMCEVYQTLTLRALALKNANAISKENLAFIPLKSSTSKNGKGKYCKFFAILATVQF